MTEIHIPDEVVEAAAKAEYELWRDQNEIRSDTLAWEDIDEDVRQSHRDGVRAAITAALAAWPGATREIRQGFSFMPNQTPKTYEVLIIRTEAST